MSKKTPFKWRAALAALLMPAMLGIGTSRADEASDHDRARKALEAREVLPLRVILDRVEREYPGQVMEVELERKNAVWLYEIKLLRKGGALVKLEVDARDGAILGIKEKGGKRHSREEER